MNKLIIFFRSAFISFKQNKTRTFLTLLGIVIGIASVIGVLSVGNSIRQLIVKEWEAFGSDFIEIEVKVPSKGKTSFENAGGIAQGINVTTLTLDDFEETLEHPNIKSGYAGNLTQDIVSYQDRNRKVSIFGVSAGFEEVDPGEIASGRFYREEEDKSLSQVVVLGSALKEKLFPNQEAVGKDIKIQKIKFTVIGVMAERGSGSFFDMDEMAFVPVRTLQKKIMGIDYILLIFLKMNDPSRAELTQAELTDIMREQHDITDPSKDDFAVNTMEEMMEILDSILGVISVLLFSIGLISLIVGGIGIMNIMYVTVSERIYEIGLRKAVGAKPQDILNQFILESVIITFIGGILGIVFGLLLTYTVSLVARYLNFYWPFSVQLNNILIATGVSLLIGLFAGFYPAKKAAEMDPVVALRGK